MALTIKIIGEVASSFIREVTGGTFVNNVLSIRSPRIK